MARLTWQAGIAISQGEFIEPASIEQFGYEATTAGNTGVTEPAWPLTAGATVTDGTVVWTARASIVLTWTASPLYKTGATEPTWPTTVGGTVTDNGITWTAESAMVLDAKCPHSPIAYYIESKVYSPYRDVLRYAVTDNPRDWTTANDAGFFPSGMHSPESPEVTGLGEYRGRLVAFTASRAIIIDVDPDPVNIVLFDSIPGIGTIYPKGIVGVSGDLQFTTPAGIRSLSIAAGAETLQSGDVGAGIDDLVKAKLAGGEEPISFYYPGSGQAWHVFDNEVFVYSQSRLGKIGAWSRYVFPFSIEHAAQLAGDLYVRAGDTLHRMDDDLTDDSGVGFEGVVWWPYLDCGSPGVTKQFGGVDIVGYGSASISIGFDQSNTAAYTSPYLLIPDTLPGGIVPIPLMAPSFAVKLTYAPGQSWQLNALNLYLQPMRMTA